MNPLELPSLPPELDLTIGDVRTYVNAIEADDRFIAYFQCGTGLVEQSFLWKYPTYREKGVLVIAGCDRRELCRLLVNGTVYFLSAPLSNLHYFFCSIPHKAVAEPLTRGVWRAQCQKHWGDFAKETKRLCSTVSPLRPVTEGV